MLHKRKVLDARGIARAVPAPRPPIATDTRTEDERQLDEMRAAFHGVPYGLWVRTAIGLIGGAVIGYGFYDLARDDVGPQDQMAAIVVSAIAGSLAAFGFFRLGVKTPNVYKVAHLLAHCRLCLCCGYDLSGRTRHRTAARFARVQGGVAFGRATVAAETSGPNLMTKYAPQHCAGSTE